MSTTTKPVARHIGARPTSLQNRVIAQLAEDGPTELAAARDMVQKLGECSETYVSKIMTGLIAEGFVKIKVWLTPEGLDHLRKTGAVADRPRLDG